jgi:hypothetical protein
VDRFLRAPSGDSFFTFVEAHAQSEAREASEARSKNVIEARRESQRES